MPRLRCRALPTIRAPVSSTTPMTRILQFTPRTTSTPSILSSRPFSSLLSTPTRSQPSQSLSRLPFTSSPITSSVSSLLTQKPFQTRSFSATASLGVRRSTYRPSRRIQKRRHGFLSRNKDHKGRKTLTRRRMKGRKAMSW
ncbi:hypothetical protein PENDEC_c012G04033 [Penicillium decumbens]|uniref:Ribosomal protein L34 n=1 Tax=Penicillium decumbens TaxID=69771 RepID=A0A1V6PBF9_PENDC|nr:hypothetical protein PENDEC_c012G04033 [Penicillium decumbens]